MSSDEAMAGQRNNPFTYAGPLNDPALAINRSSITGPLLNHLRRRDWVGIIGSPQSGRTTALYQIRTAVKDAIYINFAGADFHDLQDVWQDFAAGAGLPPLAPSLLAGRGSRVLQALERPGGLLWLIDDLAHASQREVTNDFLVAVRGYHSEGATRSRDHSHVFVFADSTDLSKISLGLGGSYFNVLQKVHLADFDQREVADFIDRRAAGAFSARSAETVFRCTGGHPCLVQFICHHVYDASQAVVERRLLDQAALIEAASAAGLPNIRKALEPLAEESERARRCAALLERILDGERVPFRPSEPTIEDLVFEYGVIRNEAGSCAIRNPIYQALLQSNVDIRKSVRQQGRAWAGDRVGEPGAGLDDDATAVLTILGQEGRMSLSSLSVKALISPGPLELALQRLKNARRISERLETTTGERFFALSGNGR